MDLSAAEYNEYLMCKNVMPERNVRRHKAASRCDLEHLDNTAGHSSPVSLSLIFPFEGLKIAGLLKD